MGCRAQADTERVCEEVDTKLKPTTKEIEEKNIELEQKISDLEKSLGELRDQVNAHRNDSEVNHTEMNVTMENRKLHSDSLWYDRSTIDRHSDEQAEHHEVKWRHR